LTGQSEDDLYANVIGEDVDEDVPLAQDMDDELRERTRSKYALALIALALIARKAPRLTTRSSITTKKTETKALKA
jgi:hypothetical protein